MKYCIFLLRTFDNFFGVFREQTLHLKNKKFWSYQGYAFWDDLSRGCHMIYQRVSWLFPDFILFYFFKNPLYEATDWVSTVAKCSPKQSFVSILEARYCPGSVSSCYFLSVWYSPCPTPCVHSLWFRVQGARELWYKVSALIPLMVILPQ